MILLKPAEVRAVIQENSRCHVTAKARVQSQAVPRGNCGGISDPGTGFTPISSGFPCHYLSYTCPILILSSLTDAV